MTLKHHKKSSKPKGSTPPGPKAKKGKEANRSFKEVLTTDVQAKPTAPAAGPVKPVTNANTEMESSPPTSPQHVKDLLPDGFIEDDYEDASSEDGSALQDGKASERTPPQSTFNPQPSLSLNGSAESDESDGPCPQSTQQEVATLRLQLAASRAECTLLKNRIGKRKRDDSSAAPAQGFFNPTIARMLNKPPPFTGAPKSNLRLWMHQMSNFLEAQQYDEATAVFTAASYLADGAAEFWLNESQRLRSKGVNVDTWHTFKNALFGRFGYKNAENTARDKLHNLRQGNMSYAQYVNAFADCYAHIPTFDEADKIHRFLNGLRPHIKKDLKVNPRTGRLWTSYHAMVTYGHVFISETDAELTREVLSSGYEQPPRQQQQQWQQQPGRHSKKSRLDPPGGQQAPREKNNCRDDKVPSTDVNNGLERQFTVCKPSGNVNFTRPRKVARFCVARKLCAHCYVAGHSPNYCKGHKKEGFPPGFDPNFTPRSRQQ